MSSNQEQLITKLRQDHAYLLELMARIRAMCKTGFPEEGCQKCDLSRREPCQMDIEHLLRALFDVSLRHHLVESAWMKNNVPSDHLIAHNADHLKISDAMSRIRQDFKEYGNGLIAIAQVSALLDHLASHLEKFDLPMEHFFLEA